MTETYPDAGQPVEHVADRHGYVWRVVRDGGMATRAHQTGLVTIGIAALERESGPLVPVVPPDRPRDDHAYWASVCTCGLSEQERTGHYPEHQPWCEVPSPLDDDDD